MSEDADEVVVGDTASETETRVLSPSAGRRRVLSSNGPRLPWCVGVIGGPNAGVVA